MQMDQPGCGKTPFVPDTFLRKLNELPCQLSASDIPAYRHAAGSIIPPSQARSRRPDKVVRIRSLYPDPQDNRRMEKMQAILGITSKPPQRCLTGG
jgi:hypothetical protein